MGTSPVGGAGEPAPVEADLTVCVVFFLSVFHLCHLLFLFSISNVFAWCLHCLSVFSLFECAFIV